MEFNQSKFTTPQFPTHKARLFESMDVEYPILHTNILDTVAEDINLLETFPPSKFKELGFCVVEASEYEGYHRAGPYVNVALSLTPARFRTWAAHPSVFAIEERGVVTRLDERQGQTVAGNVSGTGPSAPGYLAWLASHGFDSSIALTIALVVNDVTTPISSTWFIAALSPNSLAFLSSGFRSST